LVAVGQFGTWSYLKADEASLAKEIEKIKAVSNKDENAALKAQIREINGQITDFRSLIDGAPTWSKAVRQIAAHVPPEVRISTIVSDTKTKKLEVRGFSPTRELVLEFYYNIKDDTDNFASINYPLENVSRPTDVSFLFTIELKESLLKKNP
jgi:Tfp pilus assembly protein PilN